MWKSNSNWAGEFLRNWVQLCLAFCLSWQYIQLILRQSQRDWPIVTWASPLMNIGIRMSLSAARPCWNSSPPWSELSITRVSSSRPDVSMASRICPTWNQTTKKTLRLLFYSGSLLKMIRCQVGSFSFLSIQNRFVCVGCAQSFKKTLKVSVLYFYHFFNWVVFPNCFPQLLQMKVKTSKRKHHLGVHNVNAVVVLRWAPLVIVSKAIHIAQVEKGVALFCCIEQVF